MFQAETKNELTAEKLHITALADTCNVTFYASLKSDFWKSIGHVLVFIFLNTPYSSMFFIFACKFNSKSLIFKRGFFFHYMVIVTAHVRFVFYVYFFPLFIKQWYMYLYITEVLLYPITRHVTHCTDLCVTKNYESVQIATTVQLQLTWRPIINSFLTKFFINRITYCYFLLFSVYIYLHTQIYSYQIGCMI